MAIILFVYSDCLDILVKIRKLLFDVLLNRCYSIVKRLDHFGEGCVEIIILLEDCAHGIAFAPKSRAAAGLARAIFTRYLPLLGGHAPNYVC